MKDERLIHYIEGVCSEQEARAILLWIEASEANKKYFKQLYIIRVALLLQDENTGTDLSGTEEQDVFEYICTHTGKKNKKRQLYYSLYAALAGVAALLFWLFIPHANKTLVPDYEALLSGLAVSNEIVLKVGEEEPIEIQDSSVVISYKQKKYIQINDTVQIRQKQEMQLNTIWVPYGKRSLLILEDGTRVHLNSGSSLVYPQTFTGNERAVFLDGEAYFEVQQEPDLRKFIVRTSYKNIEVTGTAFNVSSDKNRSIFETVLVSGQIAVNGEKGSLLLSPNQYYSYTADSRKEKLCEVDVSNYTSWIDGKMKFTREPLSLVLYKLEKVYNIKITLLAPEYGNYRVSGILNLRNTGKETLDLLMSILTPDGKSKNLYQMNSK